MDMIKINSLKKGMIFNDFILNKKIGEGGMGQVWLATNTEFDIKVAIKILPQTDSLEEINRFQREVKLQSMLNHRSIVKSFKSGFANHHHYFVMNLVDGHDLNYFLQQGVLHERDALKIILSVAEAMEYAWDEFNMTHRDIKPGNIMVDKKLKVYLMDLGLSKMADSTINDLTLTGTFLGTPHYMSPEQGRGDELDCKSDIYSLGATLYKMLTGKHVFESANDNVMEILTKIALDEPIPPSDIQSDISAECDELIFGMLQKETDQRYCFWSFLIKDINRVLDGDRPSNRYTVKKSTTLKVLDVKFSESKIEGLKHLALTKPRKLVTATRIPRRQVATIKKSSREITENTIIYEQDIKLENGRILNCGLGIALGLSLLINVFLIFVGFG